jgi:hypothetical protein
VPGRIVLRQIDANAHDKWKVLAGKIDSSLLAIGIRIGLAQVDDLGVRRLQDDVRNMRTACGHPEIVPVGSEEIRSHGILARP